MLLGGINKPVGEDVIFTAAENAGSYPSFFCNGAIVPPTAAAAATADPEIEPNIILASTLTCAKEPGKRPPNTLANSIKRNAIPPRFIILPARIKNGIASKEKLSRPDAIFCEITAIAESSGTDIVIVSKEATPIAKEIGTPIAKRVKKLAQSTIIVDHSIIHLVNV